MDSNPSLTSVMLVHFSNQLSYEAIQLGAGQFGGFLCSKYLTIRPVARKGYGSIEILHASRDIIATVTTPPSCMPGQM